MRGVYVLERPAAIGAHPELDVEDPHLVLVLAVDAEPSEVPRALPQIPVGRDEPPCLAGVVGAEQAAVLVFDEGVDAVRVGGRNRHGADAPGPARQAVAVRDVGPGVAAVGRAPDRRALPARREAVGRPADAPHRGVEDARVRRVHLELESAHVVAHEQDALPGLAAVARAVDAPLVVRPEGVAERGGIHHVRVARGGRRRAGCAGRLQSRCPATSGRRCRSSTCPTRATRCRGASSPRPRRRSRWGRWAPRPRSRSSRRSSRPRRSPRSRRRRSSATRRRPWPPGSR